MMAGTLYVVATPLGNLEDLSPRAAATLTRAAAVAAEDTRHTKPLLAHVGSRAELISFHAHSSDAALRRAQLLSHVVLRPFEQRHAAGIEQRDHGGPAFDHVGAQVEARAVDGVPHAHGAVHDLGGVVHRLARQDVLVGLRHAASLGRVV